MVYYIFWIGKISNAFKRKGERVQVGILKNDFIVFSFIVISVETDPVLALEAL